MRRRATKNFSFKSAPPMFSSSFVTRASRVVREGITGCQMKSIVVDDEPTSQKILEKCLAEFGECRTCLSAKDAVHAIADAYDSEEPFRLVCLDIMMPDCDGHTVLQQIRDLEAERGILGLDGVKVIMVSSLSDKGSILKAFRYGCEGYVVKPVERKKLLETISSLGLVPVDMSVTEAACSGEAEAKSQEIASVEPPAEIEQSEEIKIFLVESYELVENMERELVQLEREPENPELIKSIFRAVHTIKGNSGFLNLTTLEAVCHHGEALLDKLRNRVMTLTPDSSQALLAMTDILGRTLRQVEVGQGDAIGDAPAFLSQIESLVRGG